MAASEPPGEIPSAERDLYKMMERDNDAQNF